MNAVKERVGIYGGTFSPVHFGHIRAAHAFLDRMNLDRLYVVPTAQPPHKAAAEAEAADRLEMARLAFGTNDERLIVSDCEIRREGKSYTVYTLEYYTAPEHELYMLVGSDMFLTLDEWYRAKDIFRLAHIVYIRREENDRPDIDRKIKIYRDKYDASICALDSEPLELSSTSLREKIRSGDSVEGLIPDRVIKYIKEKNLYRL